MDVFNQHVSWYQQKIGAYDKQRWETSVEEKVLKNIENAPKKTAKVKSELIDVDLVRGSTFSKAKPEHGWLALAFNGISKILFLPLYIQWWRKQTNGWFAAFILILYVLQMGTTTLYVIDKSDSIKIENLSIAHIVNPLLLMMFLGILHAQIIATHVSGRKAAQSHTNKGSIKRRITKNRRKRPMRKYKTERVDVTYKGEIFRNLYKTSGRELNAQQEIQDEETLSSARTGCSLESSGVDLGGSSRDQDLDTTDSPSSRDESEEANSGSLCVLCEPVNNVQTLTKNSEPNNSCKPDSSGHKKVNSTNFQNNIVTKSSEQNMSTKDNEDLEPTETKNIDTQNETLSKDTVTEATSNSRRPDSFVNEVSVQSQFHQCTKNKEHRVGYSYSHRKPCFHMSEQTAGRDLSSGESETEATDSHASKKAQMSEMEWEDGMQSGSSSSGSSVSDDCSSASSGLSDTETREQDNPFCAAPSSAIPSAVNHLGSPSDRVSCMFWEGSDVNKVDLSVLDIGWRIIQKVDMKPEHCDYLVVGVAFSVIMALMPLLYRGYYVTAEVDIFSLSGLLQILPVLCEHDWKVLVVILNGGIQRLCLGLIFFFLLTVAERTFKQRLQYAKHFCYLTSSRRAKKYELPHFRLNKVRNIKTWLSLRSYLKKRGPQRSVNTIVSAAFLLAVLLGSLMCMELLRDSGKFLDYLGNWELVVWCMALGIYLLRFITLGTKINKKYRNFSVLITEQINLYLHMEKKPHKKEELMLANSVLKLAEALLKELESPFKISGLSANPFLYNITKVVILSAFSGVLTELLGFKLKLYKIKIKT